MSAYMVLLLLFCHTPLNLSVGTLDFDFATTCSDTQTQTLPLIKNFNYNQMKRSEKKFLEAATLQITVVIPYWEKAVLYFHNILDRVSAARCYEKIAKIFLFRKLLYYITQDKNKDEEIANPPVKNISKNKDEIIFANINQ